MDDRFPELCRHVLETAKRPCLTYEGHIHDLENPTFIGKKIKRLLASEKKHIHILSGVCATHDVLVCIQTGLSESHTTFIVSETNVNSISRTLNSQDLFNAYHTVPVKNITRFVRRIWECFRDCTLNTQVDWSRFKTMPLKTVNDPLWNSFKEKASYLRYTDPNVVFQYLSLVSSASRQACFIPWKYLKHKTVSIGTANKKNLSTTNVIISSANPIYASRFDFGMLYLLHHSLDSSIKFITFFIIQHGFGHIEHAQLCIMDRRSTPVHIYLFDSHGCDVDKNTVIGGKCFEHGLRIFFPNFVFHNFRDVCSTGPQLFDYGGTCQLWCAWLARKCMLDPTFEPSNIEEYTRELCIGKGEDGSCHLESMSDTLDPIIKEINLVSENSFDKKETAVPLFECACKDLDCKAVGTYVNELKASRKTLQQEIQNGRHDKRWFLEQQVGLVYMTHLEKHKDFARQIYPKVVEALRAYTPDQIQEWEHISWIQNLPARLTGYFTRSLTQKWEKKDLDRSIKNLREGFFDSGMYWPDDYPVHSSPTGLFPRQSQAGQDVRSASHPSRSPNGSQANQDVRSASHPSRSPNGSQANQDVRSASHPSRSPNGSQANQDVRSSRSPSRSQENHYEDDDDPKQASQYNRRRIRDLSNMSNRKNRLRRAVAQWGYELVKDHLKSQLKHAPTVAIRQMIRQDLRQIRRFSPT
jgi:hypothetical protein